MTDFTGQFWICDSYTVDNAITHIREVVAKGRVSIKVEPYEKRNLGQNDLSFELYNRIGKAIYGGDSDLARRECKLRIGVPLLREHDPEFRELYDQVIKGHDYETKLKIMSYLPVTSRMSKKIFTQYANKVIDTYAAQGVDLGDFA